MNTTTTTDASSSMEDSKKRKEIRTLTGLSDNMINIYIMMNSSNKSGQELENVYWPNVNIKSLGEEVLDDTKPILETQKKRRTEENMKKKSASNDATNSSSSPTKKTTTTKKSISDDNAIRFIINSRRKEIDLMSQIEVDAMIKSIQFQSQSSKGTGGKNDHSIISGNQLDEDNYENYCPWTSEMIVSSSSSSSSNNKTKAISSLKDDSLLYNNNHSATLNEYAHKRDCLLMHEFVGWGLNKLGCYVFVYYIGPKDKGNRNYELKQPKNWRVVPKGHLDIFHKHINGYYTGYLKHTNMKNTESIYLPRHMSYDPRYIVSKWQKCKANSKHYDTIMKNEALFRNMSNKEYYIEVLKKRREEENDEVIDQKQNSNVITQHYDNSDNAITPPFVDSKESLSSSLMMTKTTPITMTLTMQKNKTKSKRKSYDGSGNNTTKNKPTLKKEDDNDRMDVIKKEEEEEEEEPQKRRVDKEDSVEVSSLLRKKLMNIGIANHTDLTFYPIGRNINFDLETFLHLMINMMEDMSQPPVEWEPISLVNAFAIANNPEHHARRVISTFFHINNKSFDNFDSSHLLNFIFQSKEAQEQIHKETYTMIFANMIFDFLTRLQETDELTQKPFVLLK